MSARSAKIATGLGLLLVLGGMTLIPFAIAGALGREAAAAPYRRRPMTTSMPGTDRGDY